MSKSLRYGDLVYITVLKANRYMVIRVDAHQNVYGKLDPKTPGFDPNYHKEEFLGHLEELIYAKQQT